MPLDMETYMKECSEEMSYDVIGAATLAVEKQDESSVSWSMGVSVKCATMTHTHYHSTDDRTDQTGPEE